MLMTKNMISWCRSIMAWPVEVAVSWKSHCHGSGESAEAVVVASRHAPTATASACAQGGTGWACRLWAGGDGSGTAPSLPWIQNLVGWLRLVRRVGGSCCKAGPGRGRAGLHLLAHCCGLQRTLPPSPVPSRSLRAWALWPLLQGTHTPAGWSPTCAIRRSRLGCSSAALAAAAAAAATGPADAKVLNPLLPRLPLEARLPVPVRNVAGMHGIGVRTHVLLHACATEPPPTGEHQPSTLPPERARGHGPPHGAGRKTALSIPAVPKPLTDSPTRCARF